MAHRLQYRRDTKANWLKYNPVLMEGEVGYETDTHHQKVGDGVSTYSELEYEVGVGNITQETGDSETLVISQKAVTRELAELGSKVCNLIGEGDIQSGFYDKNVNYQQSEGFCCVKIDVSNALFVRVKAYAYGNAAITLTDDSNSILHQITDNYSTIPFLVNIGEYNSAKWLYVSNSISYISIDDVLIEAVQLKESVSVSISKVNNEVQNNKKVLNSSVKDTLYDFQRDYVGLWVQHNNPELDTEIELPCASESGAGFMSADDKEKLDSLEIINDFITGGTDKALSAEMGKKLDEKLAKLESEVLNLIEPDSIRSGFYDKDLIYREAEPFCCAKIDISKTSVIRIKSYVYGNAAITLTDETNSILYQITDNYSTNAFLINVKDYVGAKWLYLSNTTSYVPSNEVIAEAVKLNESISVSIANLVNELINNNEAISDLSESFESMADNLASIEQTIEGIVGGTKTIDTSNGLVFQRKSYLDANGNIAAAGSDGWYISKYYPIDNVNRIELYARANWGFSVCAICDENKNVISTLTGIGEKKLYEITEFPEGAKYIIFHSTESDSYVIFEKKSKIKEKSLKDKNVLIIGDSISTGTSSQKRNSNWTSYGGYDKWVDRLIATGFFSDEKTYNCSWHATGFVADQNGAYDSFVKRLKAIAEPSKYEYVIVFGGINDWIKSVSMEDFKAKVDEFFLYLINNFTTARIVVITPLQCYNYEVASRYEKNNAGLYQKDYSDYIEEVCEKYAFPVLDFRRHSGFCPINETFRNRWTLVTANPDGGYWPADGTHPIKEFEDNFMAPNIQNFIEKFM